ESVCASHSVGVPFRQRVKKRRRRSRQWRAASFVGVFVSSSASGLPAWRGQIPVLALRALRRLIFQRRSRFCLVVSFTFISTPSLPGVRDPRRSIRGENV